MRQGLMERKRVVVTGVGAITPIGNTGAEFWSGLVAGRSGIRRITQFDPSQHTSQIAGEVEGFDPLDYMDKKEAKRTIRFTQFAIAASKQALADSEFQITDLNSEQVGVIIGTGTGGMDWMELQHSILREKGPDRVSPFMIPLFISNMAAGQTAIMTGAKGPNSCTVTACAAGANSIGDAYRLIEHGHAQAMLCGGTEAAITPLVVAGFAASRALATRNEEPERACRPFDKDRNGFVIGEGAGMLLLEELSHALARNARIYAEISGYGMTCDAYHMTTPSPGGEGAARAMRLALKDAGLTPEALNYINAHATSTEVGDLIEVQAIKTVLGKHAYKVAISATKSMTGHLLGGSGGIAGVATALSVYNGMAPPTLNLENPDLICDLDFVPYKARALSIDTAMLNAFGFGGHNVALVFRKFQQT
jgi:3-oxoacyl-[acyl-carrier-protein] synthase II